VDRTFPGDNSGSPNDPALTGFGNANEPERRVRGRGEGHGAGKSRSRSIIATDATRCSIPGAETAVMALPRRSPPVRELHQLSEAHQKQHGGSVRPLRQLGLTRSGQSCLIATHVAQGVQLACLFVQEGSTYSSVEPMLCQTRRSNPHASRTGLCPDWPMGRSSTSYAVELDH
jgi:hypothetical protein